MLGRSGAGLAIIACLADWRVIIVRCQHRAPGHGRFKLAFCVLYRVVLSTINGVLLATYTPAKIHVSLYSEYCFKPQIVRSLSRLH